MINYKSNKYINLLCKGLNSLHKNGFKFTLKKVMNVLNRELVRCKYLSDFNWIDEQERLKEETTTFSRNIKISILVPLYNTPIDFLKEMIESVQAQTYKNWELCLADGSDEENQIVGEIVSEFIKADNRIKYKKLEKNLGISENTNACIEMAIGDYIALFDHDDLLHPSALYEVMHAICDGADFVYTDEMVFKNNKKRTIRNFHFKPDFAIDNLRGNNYICHLTVFDKRLLEYTGGFRKEYDGSQDHDLVLRLTKYAKNIKHIPKVLYFWRVHPGSVASDINAKPYAVLAGINAVKNNIESYGLKAGVESTQCCPTIYRIKYEINNINDLVSIIIPNKNHTVDLKKCVSSILEKTTYSNYEIIIIDNASDDYELFAYYDELKKNCRVKIFEYNDKFNYSKINNFAVTKANGIYYILLNNDTEVITPNWIEEMLMYAQRSDVAVVGAKLYYQDNTIQHGGVIIGLGGIAGHAFCGAFSNDAGYMGRLCYAQNLSAVTAACMMVKANVFKEVNGLNESFEVAFNDIDFCMKVRKAGYLIVWTPYAELYHYESKFRGIDDTPEKQKRFNAEVALFKKLWKKELEYGDPYYNPNFSLLKSFKIR